MGGADSKACPLLLVYGPTHQLGHWKPPTPSVVSGTKVQSVEDHPPPRLTWLPQWIASTPWGRLVGYAAVTVGDLGGLSESLPLQEKSLLLPKLEPQPAGSGSR